MYAYIGIHINYLFVITYLYALMGTEYGLNILRLLSLRKTENINSNLCKIFMLQIKKKNVRETAQLIHIDFKGFYIGNFV